MKPERHQQNDDPVLNFDPVVFCLSSSPYGSLFGGEREAGTCGIYQTWHFITLSTAFGGGGVMVSVCGINPDISVFVYNPGICIRFWSATDIFGHGHCKWRCLH